MILPVQRLRDEGVKRLMTISGVDMVVALAIVAAIGDVGRFEQSQKLVSYLGLKPRPMRSHMSVALQVILQFVA